MEGKGENVTLIRLTEKNGTPNGRTLEETTHKMADSDSEGEKETQKVKDSSVLGRIKRFFKSAYKIIKSLVGLFVLLVLYTLLGAVIFMITEGSDEADQKSSIVDKRESVIKLLLSLSNMSNKQTFDSEMFKNESRTILIEYENTVKNTDYSSTGENVWSFSGSLFFCGTIYTTIGYGNYAPKSGIGKLLCIIYACIGIPLALIVFAELGKRFTVGLKFLWAFARRYYYTGYFRKIVKKRHKGSCDISTIESGESNEHVHKVGSRKDSGDISSADEMERSHSENGKESVKIVYGIKIDDEFNLPMTVALVIMLIYILLGAGMYTIWENWTFLDSFYFVFISISTIGFGDILPEHPNYFILSFIYIFIGLSLVSMCINVAIEFFTKTIDRAKVKMDKAKDKMTEVGKEKMERVGKQIDKTKEKAKEHYDKTRERAKEQIGKTKEKAKERVSGVKNAVTEVKKNIGENIHKEMEKIKKHSIDSSASVESGGKRSRSCTPTSQKKMEIHRV